MDQYLRFVCKFWQDQTGLSVVEYVIAAAFLVAAITTVFLAWQIGLSNTLSDVISSAGGN
ncbi:Flp family type IVb pilin [Vibrio comitans]|uniref:Fimbrial protein n=1 Tax=Vibrio comitans NBRC 102076 TaxID=1219078 RepID=A0A4Y3IQ91_9VIBR|nr:Flp family type IVb pilin [Vibrio comitans]GEA61691.1 hypothetical protein VCO01S_28840 [Vibrio comitans NBRC 102076]